MQASRVTFPLASGKPPIPTLEFSGSDSMTFRPFSIASSAEPFFFKTLLADWFAFNPELQVEITLV